MSYGNAMEHKGATEAEWRRVIALCRRDVLPSLCNTDLAANPNSKREAVEYAKTPSLAAVRDGKRCGVGIKDWPTREFAPAVIMKWQQDPDIGCGLRGREYRAIDIDVPDAKIAKAIQRFCIEFLGVSLPCRWRKDSGKRLLMFRMEADDVVEKRVIPVKRTAKFEGDFSGIIEFLFDRQFFMVSGTHPGGERYRWNADIKDTPTIKQSQLAELFDALVAKYGAKEFRDNGLSWETAKAGVKDYLTKARSRSDVDVNDPVVAYLFEQGHAIGWEYNGGLQIHCPFEHDSGKYGGSSTMYFPAGLGGRKQAGFKCLHASCQAAGNGLPQFLRKVGWETLDMGPIMTQEQYDVLPPDPHSLELTRDNKGKVETTYTNIEKVLLGSKSELRLRFDRFKQRLMISGVDPRLEIPFQDKHYMNIYKYIEHMGFAKHPSTEMLRQVMGNAMEFDSAQEWLNSIKWDGEKRIKTFHVDCLRVQDTPYHMHVGLYLLTALVGRILVPGIQADMVPTFISGEGFRKSTFARTLAPDPEMFGVINLGHSDADISRLVQGKMILELDELQGLSGRDAEAVRSIITRTKDNWVPKFKEYSADSPRRCIFIASTNEQRPLESGPAKHRRWLPVRLVDEINAEYLTAHRDQLFAEAKAIYEKRGIMYKTVNDLAGPARENARQIDPWRTSIQAFLAQAIEDSGDPNYVPTTSEIATDAVGRKMSTLNRFDSLRIAKIMSSLGYDQSDSDEWNLII